MAGQETTICEATNDIKFHSKNNDGIYQGKFSIKHLLSFNKCSNLCSNLKLFLKNDNIEMYRCNHTEKRPLSAGVNILQIFKLLKTTNNDDVLYMSMDDQNVNVLEIIITNQEKGANTRYLLNLIDLNKDTLNIPKMEFDTIITYNSLSFQKLIKGMNALKGKTVEIKCSNNKLIYL